MGYDFYRTVRISCNLLLSFTLVARLLLAAIPAWNSQQNYLGSAVLVLCGVRLIVLVIDVVRGVLQWQRSIFPSIILLGLVSIFGGQHSTLLVKISVATLELGILGLSDLHRCNR